MAVHNHGTEDGPGLGCREHYTAGGALRGVCQRRWSVRKRRGVWRIYDQGTWHDTCDTLAEAHTYATQCAVFDELCEPGGLSRLSVLLGLARENIELHPEYRLDHDCEISVRYATDWEPTELKLQTL